jgi:GntR family transcriptional regulator
MKTSLAKSKALCLDHNSFEPLHAQAERLLRELIQQPEYVQGALLPPEVSLAGRLGISRSTLRMAIARLEAEGRLERKSGVGTRVVEPRVKSGVGAWQSFTREMEAKGIKVETYLTRARLVPANEAVARALQVPAGTGVLCLERVRGWDAQPEVSFTSHFHPRLGLTTEEDFQKPLYEMIRERTSVVADHSFEEFVAEAADRRLARLLQVPAGTPLLRRERTVLDTGGRPMEFAVVRYRCDRFRLTLSLRQES